MGRSANRAFPLPPDMKQLAARTSVVHQRSGRVDWLSAPIKLAATVLTLGIGISIGVGRL
jgi:H+/Cl- antiporter ClcA